MNKIIIGLLLVLILSGNAFAVTQSTTLAVPNTFKDMTTADAGEVNENFSTFRNDYILDVGGDKITLDSQVQGTIMYFNGTTWVILTPGTDGQYLETNGSGADPAWSSVTAGSADSLVDADADTQIQVEESADEDIIRVDIGGTETVVFGDGTNEAMVAVANTGSNHGIDLNASGVLASGDHALYVRSATAQTNEPLVNFEASSATNTAGLAEMDNDGTGTGLYLHQDGALATAKYGLRVRSNAAQTTGGAYLFYLAMDSASSTINNCVLENQGTGTNLSVGQDGILAANKWALYVLSSSIQDTESMVHFNVNNASTSKEALEITYLGDGNSILADGATLNNAGEWTNKPCFAAEKDIIKEVAISGFIDKLKNLKLYEYQVKREVYGAKEDILSGTGEELEKHEKGKKDGHRIFKGNKEYKVKGNKKYEVIDKKYGTAKKHPNARIRKGYVLDDPTTPEELISRKNLTGEIAGISPADGVNFLLAVCKELTARIETLEARVEALENP